MRGLERFITIFIIITLIKENVTTAEWTESDRIEEYHNRGFSWPPSSDEYTPSTPGWQRINKRRFDQLRTDESDADDIFNMYAVRHTDVT